MGFRGFPRVSCCKWSSTSSTVKCGTPKDSTVQHEVAIHVQVSVPTLSTLKPKQFSAHCIDEARIELALEPTRYSVA